MKKAKKTEYDVSAVCNITYAARVFVGMLDNHGIQDLRAASVVLLHDAEHDENLSGFQKKQYEKLGNMIVAVCGGAA